MQHILVEGFDRDVVLNRGVAICNQGHVEAEQRTTFRNRAHILVDCGSYNLLALVAARLVIILDAARALRLKAADVRQRIGLAVNLRIDVRVLRAIDDLTGRKAARPDNLAGAHHFQRREDQGRTAGGIVTRRDTEREVDHFHPVGLRGHFIDAIGTMGMGIDQAGYDGLSDDIHGRDAGRDRC